MYRSGPSSPYVQVGPSIQAKYLCIPDRYPPLLFRRWFKEENEQLTPIKFNERIFIVSGGLLKISKAKIEDSGKYLCWVNNTAGEETIQVLLTITGNSFSPNQSNDDLIA